jgi:DNA modification methylase
VEEAGAVEMGPTGIKESKNIKDESYSRIVRAARDEAPVFGYTHNFYRYPARFSPKFVRAVIEAFSEAGDLVLDPFMGGGTTLVEALAQGRNAIGADISSLAIFVAQVKTSLLNEEDLELLGAWAWQLCECVNMHTSATHFSEYAASGYYRHLESAKTWRLRRAIEQALTAAIRLKSPRLEAFARCVVLRAAQWALDGRKQLPTVGEFRDSLVEYAEQMIAGAYALRAAAAASAPPENVGVFCLQRSAIGLEKDLRISRLPKPKLILTSPPYPGIHVLYHRWQVDGRKETPAPFWIANQLDGSGGAFYTMGDRKAADLRTYFGQLDSALKSIARLCSEDTTVVQVVAFTNPSWQLARYLEGNKAAGLEEILLPNLAGFGDGRLRRTVPNRKWHADQLGKTSGSEEVVLFHRLSR